MRWRARIDAFSERGALPGAGGVVLGAGTLLTSRHVLTCAHVVAGRDELWVAFPGLHEHRQRAVVEFRGGWRAMGDTGDVAVLRLDEPAPVAPCRPAPLDALRDPPELRAQGFPLGHERDGTHVTLRTSADRVLRREWLEVDVGSEHLRRLDQGFSGAGVYDPRTGRVVGMVTDAELHGHHEGTIGRMVPLETVRRHWEPLDDLLPHDWLPAEPRAELRGLLAGAETTEPPAALFRLAFPLFLRPPAAFHSLWDAVRYVGECVPGEDRLARFLNVVAGHLDGEVRIRLDAWMRDRSPGAAAAGPSPASAPQTSIIVRLETTTRGPYELTLSTLVEGVPGRPTERVSVRKNQIRPHVERALPALMRSVLGRDRDWMIEFVVPERLLNEPFEEWSIKEAGSARPRPMRSVPLVVRHVERLRPLLATDLTRRRWRTLRERGSTRPDPVACHLGYGYDEFYDWLDASDESCALVYASNPNADWLSAALSVGIPVMLWRRHPCNGPCDADACTGRRFLTELTTVIDKAHPDELPAIVMKLRKQARIPPGNADHCGNGLALFWDDPARNPDPPLAMRGT
ncbi:trypsin-like peptidase domain-containing protein [Spirillospora sp. NPDC048911]|uniref:VMAP-C domain-containing protein n=1 Tax=Spirillospora sp. NPDC048911 TaxID=3364527 RepID=UPI0037107FA6